MRLLVFFCVLFHLLSISAHAEEYNSKELLTLIKACADIGDFDSSDFNENELMRRFFYTYRNFEILSNFPTNAVTSDKITVCDSRFVQDAVYKAFRLDAPSPKPHLLTELGFCENNGYYSFYGGYSEYFATDVKEIVKIIPLPDNTDYVIFSNDYQEGENKPIAEYSSMIVAQDNDGYFVKSINMNDDFRNLWSLLNPKPETDDAIWIHYLPVAVIVSTLSLVCLAFYIFFVRK